MSLKSVPSSLRVRRWPTFSWSILSLLGGLSFWGGYLVPTWLGSGSPLFFLLTPVLGPFLLALAGLLAIRHSRAISNDPALQSGRLFVPFLISCAILLAPVTILDFVACLGFAYFALVAVVIVLPFHLVCIAMFAVGLYALSKATGRVTLVFRCALPVIAGFLVSIALTFVRFKYAQSEGIFLKGFTAAGSPLRLPGKPLDPRGQKDILKRPGEYYEIRHKPIAVIGDDSVWLVRHNERGAWTGYWLERRAIAPGGSNWRLGFPAAPGMTYNPTGPTALALGPSSSIFVVGFSSVAGNASSWIKRYDAKGAEDTNWNKSFPVTNYFGLIYGLRLDGAGSVYVSGQKGEIDRAPFGWVRKFNPDGREQIAGWDKRLPTGAGLPTLAVDSAGNVCVLDGAHCLRKLNHDGRELWQRQLPKLKDVRLIHLSISADDQGNVFIYGISGYPGQAWIKKFRADGSDAWEKKFALGDHSAACAVAFDRAQNIYVAGYPGWWIKKFDPAGVELTSWSVKGGDVPFTLHVNFRDELYILGWGGGWQLSGSWLERFWWGD